MQAHGDWMVAQLADGLVEQNLAPVDGEFQLLQALGDILGGNRAKELIILAGLLLDDDDSAVHQLGQIRGFALQLGLAAQMRLALLLDDLLVGFGGRDGQPVGQ